MITLRTASVAAALVVATAACGDDAISDRAPDLAPSDVTFLVSLGAVSDFGATTDGGHGVLLPRERYDHVEALTRIDEPDALYENLDVVGVRLDPCFFEGTGDVICLPQVRLVMQPVFDEGGAPISRDATVHAFYDVPVGDVQRLADDLARLRVAHDGSVTISEHVAPEEATALVLPHVGADRLSRVTFVSVHASNEAWTFGGFDIIDGAVQDIIPPGVEDHAQHLTSTGGTERLDASILPPPEIEAEAALWLTELDREEMDADTEAEAIAGLERLLDPGAHNPGTVDCASCHMATTGLYHAQMAQGGATAVPGVYANSQNQRMLGFFDRDPAISPRVEAETLAVLEALDAL